MKRYYASFTLREIRLRRKDLEKNLNIEAGSKIMKKQLEKQKQLLKELTVD
jgi:hypothetical protein